MRPPLIGQVQPVAVHDSEQLLGRHLLFFDDFDKSKWTALPWFMTFATTGAAIALDATAGLVSSGGQTMKYTSGTQAGSSSEVHRYHVKPPNAASFFFGGRFHLADSANPSNIGLYIGFRDGVNWTRGKVLVTGAGVVSYVDASGANQQLLSRSLQASATRARWHTWLVQVNFTTGLYERVLFDELDFAAPRGQPLRSTADATVPNLLDFAVDNTDTASSGAIYYDELYGGWV